MFRFPREQELTLNDLADFIKKHKAQVKNRYKPLLDAYMSDHEILHHHKKDAWKPDNRIVVNFPKYIVDTMNGFFVGNPIKTTAKDKKVGEFVEFIEKYNDTDNINSALATACGIFGKAYEMYFADEESNIAITTLDPTEAFMIYDESIIERPLYFVRLYTDRDNVERGSISNATEVAYFKVTGGMQWTDEPKQHFYKGVPAVEYINNEIKQGLFEPVLTQINAYNKAISEKANDVDYFADAYLKVLGAEVKKDDVQFIRNNRIMNFFGEGADKILVEFMDKPNNDTAQENLLDRLERHIFQGAMVANISDENFGGSSGTALQYRLLNMSNLMEDKKRKFASSLNKRYKLIFSHPASKVNADAWTQLEYKFTPNLPKNLLEESNIAKNVTGLVSQKTQLKTLSIVENVEAELEEIKKENEAAQNSVVDDKILGFEPTPQAAEVVDE